MTLFRLKYRTGVEHTHVRVFAGKGTLSLGFCGHLCFRNTEWEDFKKNVYHFLEAGSDIELVEDD